MKKIKEENLKEKCKKLFYDRPRKGRPTLLPSNVNTFLLNLIKATREAGGKLTPLTVVSLGNATAKHMGLGPQLQSGALTLSTKWAECVVRNQLGWCQRKATTDRKLIDSELNWQFVTHSNNLVWSDRSFLNKYFEKFNLVNCANGPSSKKNRNTTKFPNKKQLWSIAEKL
ncbi:hypothetical protein P9112_006980 [Eukaryota sp. TZLM1-RC]